MDEWFYVQNDQPQGPLSESALGLMLEQKQLSKDTLIWCKRMPDWLPASKVPQFVLQQLDPAGAAAFSNPAPAQAQAAKAEAPPEEPPYGQFAKLNPRMGASSPNDMKLMVGGGAAVIVICVTCAIGGYFVGKTQGKARALEQYNTIAQLIRKQDNITAEASETRKYLMTSSPFDEDSVKTRFVRMQAQNPNGNANLQYSLLLEKGWTQDKANHSPVSSEGQLNVLASFHSNNFKDVSIVVMAKNVSKDVRLEDCLNKYLWSDGFAVLQRTDELGNRLQGIVRVNKDGEEMLGRVTAVRSGDNVFWLICYAPKADFPRWADKFTISAMSFSPYQMATTFQPDVPTQHLD